MSMEDQPALVAQAPQSGSAVGASASPVAVATKPEGRSWWFDVFVFLWPLVVAAGVFYFSGQRANEIAAAAAQAPPRIVVLDELALIQMVVREERLTDIDSVRRRVSEVVKPYTDAGYVVIGDISIVSAPSALVLPSSDLEALYARSKR